MSISTSDPIGAALVSYLNGETEAIITVYSDQTEPDELPVNYLFRSFDEMPEREQFAVEQCRGRVLDVGSGAGSHVLALQEKGLEVTSLELSELACEVQRERGVKNVLCGDFYKLTPQSHDTLLLLMNGIGIAGSVDNLPKFLQTCRQWLAPGGQILLESSDILYLYEDEDGSVVLDLNADYYGEMTYVMEYKQQRTEPFKWLFLDFDLLQQYAEEAGFTAELLLQEEDAHYIARLTVE